MNYCKPPPYLTLVRQPLPPSSLCSVLLLCLVAHTAGNSLIGYVHQRRVPGACGGIVGQGMVIGSQINVQREKGFLQGGRFGLELHTMCQVGQESIALLRGKASDAASQAGKEFFLREAFDRLVEGTCLFKRRAAIFRVSGAC